MPHHDAFPETGFIRLKSIIGPKGPIPVSRSTWYSKVKAGVFPAPVRIGPKTMAYPVAAIRDLIARIEAGEV